MAYNWEYFALKEGRLVYDATLEEVNINFPSFSSIGEAGDYLYKHDIRGSVTREVKSVAPAYPDYIMKKVRQKRGWGEYDTSRDGQINDMSKSEVFDACLEWEGIIGYGYSIKGWIKDIYGITLE